MINDFHELSETWKQIYKILNLSTAAFVVAMEKIATSEIALEIFP